jgi:Secretion system C-terminal sorting domain
MQHIFKFILFIFCFFVWPSTLQAQNCFTPFEWIRPDTNNFYGNAGGVTHYNGYIYHLGKTLQKLDTLGNLIWEKPGQGNQLIVDNNGEIIITGYANQSSLQIDTHTFSFLQNDQFFIAKLDSSGDYLWSNVFSFGQYYSTNNVRICNDFANNIYLINATKGLLKLSPSGQTIWSKLINTIYDCDVKYSAIDSTIVIAGVDFSGISIVDSGLYIQKLNLDSNVLFTKRFGRNDIQATFHLQANPRLYINQSNGNIYISSNKWHYISTPSYLSSGLLKTCDVNGLNDSVVTYFNNAISELNGNNDSLIFINLDQGGGISSYCQKINKRNLIANTSINYCFYTIGYIASWNNSLYSKCYSTNHYFLAKIGIDHPTQIFFNNKNDTLCSQETYQNPLFINLPSNSFRYQWSPSNGVNDSTLRNPIFSTTSNTNFTLSIVDTFGNVLDSSMHVFVYPKINVNATISNAEICKGDSVKISINNLLQLYNSPEYTFPINSSISNFFYPNYSHSIIVSGKDSNSCIWTDFVHINVHQFTSTNIVVTPSNKHFCTGDTAIISTNNAYTTVWSGGIINALPFVPINTQTYTMQATDSLGCTFTDSVKLINSSDSFSNLITPSNDTAFCYINNYFLSTPITANNNVWRYDNIIVSSTANCFVPIGSNKHYVLTSTNSFGCKTMDSVLINNFPKAIPTIKKNNTMLFCTDSKYTNYEWYYGSTIIGFGPTVLFSNIGLYTLKVIDTNGCSGEKTITVSVASKLNDIQEIDLQIYPNPIAEDLLNIKMPIAGLKKINIYNATGAKMFELESENMYEQINTSRFANGVYFISITLNTGETIYRKVVKNSVQ